MRKLSVDIPLSKDNCSTPRHKLAGSIAWGRVRDVFKWSFTASSSSDEETTGAVCQAALHSTNFRQSSQESKDSCSSYKTDVFIQQECDQ